jgi:hypothetical protein
VWQSNWDTPTSIAGYLAAIALLGVARVGLLAERMDLIAVETEWRRRKV